MKQILINLCANAIKFTGKGQVTLNIAQHEHHLTFTVSDTGIGISEQQLAQVFKLFTQADNSISRRFGGSGLGLSLSTQLAKLMSGNITVTSQLRQGSKFCLTLPCQQQKKPNLDSEINVIEYKTNHQFSGKILLADDHHDNRRLIARLLENLGLEVLSAENGLEAVELCVKHQPKLVLLDIQMPKMDGVEAFYKLRSLGCSQAIYALTANAMSHEVSQYLAQGFTGHLKKPIEMKNFIAIIAKYYTDDATSAAVSKSMAFESQPKLNKTSVNEPFSTVDLSDLIADFRGSLGQDKEKVIRYNDEGNYAELGKVAHSISGAAQMFGFTELSQAAKELDVAIKTDIKSRPEPIYNSAFLNDLSDCLVDEINLAQTINKLSNA